MAYSAPDDRAPADRQHPADKRLRAFDAGRAPAPAHGPELMHAPVERPSVLATRFRPLPIHLAALPLPQKDILTVTVRQAVPNLYSTHRAPSTFKKDLAMKRRFSAMLLGVLMISTGASYASAGWMDNVPARFLPGSDRPGANQSRTSETVDGGLVTGSINSTDARSQHAPRSGRPGKP